MSGSGEEGSGDKGSGDKVYGDMENATNTDPSETADVEKNPSDTVSGGTPDAAGDGDE